MPKTKIAYFGYMASTVTTLAGAILFLSVANAGEAMIGPVYIYAVSALNTATSGHLAGNLEVAIKNGFVVPSGLNCDGTYLTTLRSVDSDKRLYALATTAVVTKQPVNLIITDNPNYSAFPGRCSIEAITVISQ